jgi:type I restriction enzyme M protein
MIRDEGQGYNIFIFEKSQSLKDICKNDKSFDIDLINASEKFKPLKKSKGSKRKEIDEENRLVIVATLTAYQDNDYAKVFDKEFFYFNKQAIQLTNTDEDGNFFAQKLKVDNVQLTIDNCQLTTSPNILNSQLTTINYLGCGKIVVKSLLKKSTKKLAARIEITVELIPDYQKDYEIIPFHKDEDANQQAITAFIAKYISKPFSYLDNVVGVELNFNKIFYKPENLQPVSEILAEIEDVDPQLKELEAEFRL